MTLYALDIPDDPAQLPGWLERHLVGLDLGALVAELAAVHGAAPGGGPPIQELLGGSLELVPTRGLRAVPPVVLKQLLVQPHRLLDLQEWVLSRGGPYWERLSASQPPVADLAARGRPRLV